MWIPYLRIEEFIKKYENGQFHIPAFLTPETEKTEKVDADIRLWKKVQNSLEESTTAVERKAEAKKQRKKQKNIREKILEKNREKYGFDDRPRSKTIGLHIYQAELKAKGQFKIFRFLMKMSIFGTKKYTMTPFLGGLRLWYFGP